MMRQRAFAILGLLASLGGCAEMTSVYHSRAMVPERAITVDSYQRSTYVTRVPTDPAGQVRLCAEAAPDTFAALSASLAAEGDVTKRSASIAAAISQSGATIERTQTINLLRESMYRTCERYLSGAITKELMIVQAARDQRSMVAVLAIEQLTRAARPPAVVVSAGATRASLPNKALVDLVTDLRAEEKKAGKAYEDAKSAYGKVSANCTGAKPADGTDAGKIADWTKCDDARTAMNDRKKELDTASARVNTFAVDGQDDAGGAGPVAGTTEGPNGNGAGGGTLTEPAITAVAKAVTEIANGPGIDETLMFCIAYASNGDRKLGDPLLEQCLDIMKLRAAADDKRVLATFDQARFESERPKGVLYRDFQPRLIALVKLGTDKSVKVSITNFEQDAGLSTGLGPKCTTKAICLKKIAGDPYLNDYQTHGPAMEAALRKWQ